MLAANTGAMSLTASRFKSNWLPSRSAYRACKLAGTLEFLTSECYARNSFARTITKASALAQSLVLARAGRSRVQSFCVLVSFAGGADASRVLLAASKARFIVVGWLMRARTFRASARWLFAHAGDVRDRRSAGASFEIGVGPLGAVKPASRSKRTAAMARAPVLPEANRLGALSAQLRHRLSNARNRSMHRRHGESPLLSC